MLRLPSRQMSASIERQVESLARQGGIVDIGDEALKVQQRFPHENIATEDVAEFFIKVAIRYQVGLRFPAKSSLQRELAN